MRYSQTFVFLALTLAGIPVAAREAPRTVCTITVNSADEKEAFRRRLPAERYRFVELVEKGRADWLRSSCEKAVQCDVLVVSGHFNAGDYFYSDRLGSEEYLAIDELERAACSDSCPALFSRLKEVYLFGCESLNPDASKYASTDGDSGRDRMRRIFAGVPVIYGFPSSAPLGPVAAGLLDRYFDAGGSEVGSGRASARLLSAFARTGMTSTPGRRTSAGPAHPAPICQLFDDRLTPDLKFAAIHGMLRRDPAGAGPLLERIGRMHAALTPAQHEVPALQGTLAAIAADAATRERYLAAERATGDDDRRSGMITLAATLGWLSTNAHRAEHARMIDDVLARASIGFAEVGLACGLGHGEEVAAQVSRDVRAGARQDGVGRAAVRACLGDAEARARVLGALASADEREVQIAQTYLRHRPLSDAGELRALARGIARMPGTGARVRALDALGRLQVTDGVVLEGLATSFATAPSLEVQRAIAEVFLRSGSAGAATPGLVATLRRHRFRSHTGDDLIDVLIRRLESAS